MGLTLKATLNPNIMVFTVRKLTLTFSFLLKVIWQPDQGVTVGVQRRSGRRVSSSRQPEVREERRPASQRALVRDVRHLRSAVGGVARQEGQGPVTSLGC